MNLAQALKAGILPTNTNPIEIISTAHKEGLEDLLQKQVRRHHQIMRRAHDVNEARQLFQVTNDFTESDLLNMPDLKAWPTRPSDSNAAAEDDTGIINDMLKSVYIDSPAPSCSVNHSFSILKSLRRKKIYRPVDDSSVTNCHKCGVTFSTLFNRRHHCRACGRIFCHNCSQWTERIPSDLVSYLDTKGWIIPGQMSRVCQSCKDNIINFRRIEGLVRYFEIVAYPFDLCVRAATLCRDWREAMRIYLSNIRDMQYCVPATPLSDRDRRALHSNMEYIQGHSKWLLQALKIGLLPTEGKRLKSCQEMMCDRNCTEELTPFDAIIMLNTPTYNIEVKLLALRILERSQFPPDLALFLPIEDSSIQEFILRRSDLFLDFFWLSRINHGLSTDIFRNKLLLANQDQAALVQESIKLISMLDEHHNNVYELSQRLQTLKVPFVGPFGRIDGFDHDITVKNSVTRPIIMRYSSEGIKRAFLYKQEDVRKDAHVVALIRLMYYLCADIFVTSKDSCFLRMVSPPIDIGSPSKEIANWFVKESPLSSNSSSPHSLPVSYKYPGRQSLPILPIMNDLMAFTDDTDDPEGEVVSLPDPDPIRLSVPKLPEIDNSFLATYRVMPISTGAGFIEIVPNASTLSEILSRGTISNYLYRPTPGKLVTEVSSNYSASLAFWTVITYILGVGDRHLDNIMIRNDGTLFHIDYGFVFGTDSTASFVRLDHNLIEGLGGVEMYEPFKARCCEIYSSLRRYFSLICACLMRLASIRPPIKGYNFTSEFIEKFITERFMLGQTEEEAKEAFSNIIDSSRENIIHKVSDVIHNTVSSLKVGWWSY